MKKGKLIALAGSIVLVLVLVLSACAPSATPTTPAKPTTPATPTTPSTPAAPQVVTKEVERTYKVLSPRGIMPEIQTSALAPRLTTLDGKTVYLDMGESTNIVTQPLFKNMAATYPKTTFKTLWIAGFGSNAPPADALSPKVDAYIRGLGW